MIFWSFTGCAVVFIVHADTDALCKFVRFLSSLSMPMAIDFLFYIIRC